ncbi:hypothetical protein ATY27_19355 [Rheinheimera sp. F8]|nr:hypothetical protein ATY27_10300 [Rheinheimera sp. F8]ALZ77701.1 hypothetical protein ATY27_19355 [Rheinheimera sp. F8]
MQDIPLAAYRPSIQSRGGGCQTFLRLNHRPAPAVTHLPAAPAANQVIDFFGYIPTIDKCFIPNEQQT